MGYSEREIPPEVLREMEEAEATKQPPSEQEETRFVNEGERKEKEKNAKDAREAPVSNIDSEEAGGLPRTQEISRQQESPRAEAVPPSAPYTETAAERMPTPEKGEIMDPEQKKRAFHDMIRWHVIANAGEHRGIIWEGPADADYESVATKLTAQERATIVQMGNEIWERSENFIRRLRLESWPKGIANRIYFAYIDRLIRKTLRDYHYR